MHTSGPKGNRYEQFSRHLKRKNGINIMVTNVCNLDCTQCSQLIPYFSEQWFIPPSQLEGNIRYFRKFVPRKTIGLFGGEPTVHPEWLSILEMLQSYPDSRFFIFSNGVNRIPDDFKLDRKKGSNHFYKKNNISMVVNKKGRKRSFFQTLYALQDKYTEFSREQCATYALKNCAAWGTRRCWLMVYDNKAYFCEQAAAWERLKIGPDNWQKESCGWDLNENFGYCFLQTKTEITRQAENVCYRCGWSHRGREPLYKKKPTISPINQPLLDYNK